MLFSELCETLDALEATSSRLEKTKILAELFGRLKGDEAEFTVYLLLGKLAPDYMGIELGLGDKMIIKALTTASGENKESVEKLYEKLGDLGLVAKTLLESKRGTTLLEYLGGKTRSLGVQDIHAELLRIAKTSGGGSQEEKISILTKLLLGSSPREAKYIIRMVSGDIRLGVAEPTIVDALASVYTEGDTGLIERAFNITSDLGYVAKTLTTQGVDGVRSIRVTPGRPLQPMLAERATSLQEIFERMGGRAALEYKYDGERMQAHRHDSQTTLFSRRIENITHHYPDVAANLQKSVNSNSYIVEGEIVAIDPDSGEMLPFQELMHRRRKHGVEEAAKKYPARVVLFDVLYADGVDYTPKPYLERRSKLESMVKPSDLVVVSTGIVADSVNRAQEFFDSAIESGCEGIMAKTLDTSVGYQAGKRGYAWIKFKREYRSELTDTLDLVVVGGFYGKGRRAGKIGGYLMAAYNSSTDGYDTVCKVATGFSDQDLVEIPKLLEAYRIPTRHPQVNSNIEADIWYRPAVVFEIIGAELTVSPMHTAAYSKIREGKGLAVRFPRFTGTIRTDKSPTEATSVDELLEMYNSQLKRVEAGGA
ncbi:MAG: ATP-dependent DNA ligase [Thermoprotei archaeon]